MCNGRKVGEADLQARQSSPDLSKQLQKIKIIVLKWVTTYSQNCEN